MSRTARLGTTHHRLPGSGLLGVKRRDRHQNSSDAVYKADRLILSSQNSRTDSGYPGAEGPLAVRRPSAPTPSRDRRIAASRARRR
jgi:hypothetical protein